MGVEASLRSRWRHDLTRFLLEQPIKVKLLHVFKRQTCNCKKVAQVETTWEELAEDTEKLSLKDRLL